MIEDRYNVVLGGAFRNSVDKKQTIERLAVSLGLPKSECASYFKGGPKVFKQDLTFDEAKKLHRVLDAEGALCEIGVVLDERVLETSSVFPRNGGAEQEHRSWIRPADDTAFPSSADQVAEARERSDANEGAIARFHAFDQTPRFRFNTQGFAPAAFSLKASEIIVDSSGRKIGTMESKRFVLGWASTVLAAIVLALFFARVLLMVLAAWAGTGVVVISTAVLVLPACILYVPRLLRWGKTIVIKEQPGKEDRRILECREGFSAGALSRRFLVSDSDGKPLADIRYNRILSRFSYAGGSHPLQVVEDEDALDDSVAAGGGARKQEGKALAFLTTLLRAVPALIGRVTPGRERIWESRFQRWKIRTTEGKIAATVLCRRSWWAGQGGICILDVDPQVSYGLDRRLLISLALVISGI